MYPAESTTVIVNCIPAISWIAGYTKEAFAKDIAAGVTVFVFLVPQGMAYALLAGMPPIYGLYSSIVPLCVYAIFGTSRQLSIGPMAITSLLLHVCLRQDHLQEQSAPFIAHATNLSMITGILLTAMGALRLGSLVNLISDSVMVGFLTASSLVIILSQLKYVLGLTVPRYDYTYQSIYFIVRHVFDTNIPAALLGLSTVAALLFAKALKYSLTMHKHSDDSSSSYTAALRSFLNLANLLAIIAGAVVSYLLSKYGYSLDIVGEVPSGLKAPNFQFLGVAKALHFIPAGLSIAFVAFTGNWAVAKKYATLNNYDINASQELLAGGLAIVIGVLCNSFVVSGGLARSAVNAESGAQTPFAGVIVALCMLVAVQYLTETFYYIPMCTLGAVIIVSVLSMIEFDVMLAAYHTHPRDCLVMVVTLLATFFVGVSEGLYVGISCSVLVILHAAAYPYIAVLGRLPPADTTGTTGVHYRDHKRFDTAKQIPGVVVLRMDAMLFFANCAYFKETVLQASTGKFHTSEEAVHTVVVDASAWFDIDLAGTKALLQLRNELLKARQIDLIVAAANGAVREKIALISDSARVLTSYSVEAAVVDATSDAGARRRRVMDLEVQDDRFEVVGIAPVPGNESSAGVLGEQHLLGDDISRPLLYDSVFNNDENL